MEHDASLQLETIIQQLIALKREILNRDDPRFKIWYKSTRDSVNRFTPNKLLAFDEISFASDFFLSKSINERIGINDRIALVSDFELADQILRFVLLQVKANQDKSHKDFLKPKISTSKPNKRVSLLPKLVFDDSETGWEELSHLLESGAFADREKVEASAILQNLRKSLSDSDPDWDQMKRGIKFLLEFDRHLAIEAVPFLLLFYKFKRNSPE